MRKFRFWKIRKAYLEKIEETVSEQVKNIKEIGKNIRNFLGKNFEG